MKKKNKKRKLQAYIPIDVESRNFFVQSTPTQAKSAMLLAFHFAENPEFFLQGIPLASCSDPSFRAIAGFTPELADVQLATPCILWQVKDSRLYLPFANVAAIRKYQAQQKAGCDTQEKLKKKKLSTKQLRKTKQESLNAAEEYTIPENLKDYAAQEETENDHAKD